MVCTAWKPFKEMEITLVSEAGPEHDLHLQARWRIRKSTHGYVLALECLTIPMNDKVLQSMSTTCRELCEGPGAPVTVLWISDPITWILVRRCQALYPVLTPPFYQPQEDLNKTGLDIVPYLSLNPENEDDPLTLPEDAYIRR